MREGARIVFMHVEHAAFAAKDLQQHADGPGIDFVAVIDVSVDGGCIVIQSIKLPDAMA